MNTLALWADYDTDHPPTADQLRAAGFVGVHRYLVPGHAKSLTPAEYRDLRNGGIEVFGWWEIDQNDYLGDYQGGLRNARTARSYAVYCGADDTFPIGATVDMHLPTSADVQKAVRYVRGFRDVLGYTLTGCYGFPELTTAVRSDGCAAHLWGTGHQAADLTWWQRNGSDGEPAQKTVGSVLVDISNQLLPIGEDLMIALDQEVPVPLPDGTEVHISPLWMLQNLYTWFFYGGKTPPWDSVSGVALLKEIAAHPAVTELGGVDMGQLAQQIGADLAPALLIDLATELTRIAQQKTSTGPAPALQPATESAVDPHPTSEPAVNLPPAPAADQPQTPTGGPEQQPG